MVTLVRGGRCLHAGRGHPVSRSNTATQQPGDSHIDRTGVSARSCRHPGGLRQRAPAVVAGSIDAAPKPAKADIRQPSSGCAGDRRRPDDGWGQSRRDRINPFSVEPDTARRSRSFCLRRPGHSAILVRQRYEVCSVTPICRIASMRGSLPHQNLNPPHLNDTLLRPGSPGRHPWSSVSQSFGRAPSSAEAQAS